MFLVSYSARFSETATNVDTFFRRDMSRRDKIANLVSTVGNPIDRLDSLRTDTKIVSHQLRSFFRRLDIFLDGIVRHLQQEERVGVTELVILDFVFSYFLDMFEYSVAFSCHDDFDIPCRFVELLWQIE